jgi:hypothetical protein
MRRFALIAISLFTPFVPLACSDEPAAETRDGFCDRWAEAACNNNVVSACQAASVDACRVSQERFCLGLVPASGFVDERADACIGAVGAAYADADLTVLELDTVLRLGPPCDQLVRGTRTEGASCTSRLDCDGPAGFDCVFKGSQTSGTCQRPEVASPGTDCSDAAAICTEGFYCDGDNCIEGNDPGEACLRDAECADGYCGPNDVCVAGLSVNTTCTDDAQCVSGFCYAYSASERVCTDRVRLSRTDPACEDLQ